MGFGNTDGNEALSRTHINELLKGAGWNLTDKNNVDLEARTEDGKFADYILKDRRGFPLCVLEAKKNKIEPLSAKEQARGYADSKKARFIILSNGVLHYLWDIEKGNPTLITKFPTQEELLENKTWNPNPQELIQEKVDNDYIIKTQYSNYEKDKELNGLTEDNKSKLKRMRDYQVKAINSVQNAVKNNKNRFLLEMATGTGKTLTTAGIIKLFLKTQNAKRVLFLVDRIELEMQAEISFKNSLGNGWQCCIYKEHKDNWRDYNIVISTIQTMSRNKHYQNFSRTDFDLLISDEAHRSISGEQRAVFEYFVGYKLGLTATPKDYIKNTTGEEKNYEERLLKDTYKIFDCEKEATFRYSLNDGVKDGFLINPYCIDARTEKTTKMLKEEGLEWRILDENNEEQTENFGIKDFERNFFSEETNLTICNTFIDNALRDPINDEVGKTVFYCVSQNHAAKITNILNELAMQKFQGKYQSDFAMQVTSQVQNVNEIPTRFRNNKLGGVSKIKNDYETSKCRVCVCVGMMTTGYDCEDILNIVLCRPIFSPSEFIQIKGRGTRKTTFKFENKKIDKTQFYLFDFFGNIEYFENPDIYNKKLSLLKSDGIVKES
ncbi:MAG: DEAD/DEAH box helicase family protein, partial [Rickettsiales bacterium]|nr:DEAD/DEAH box helicase family protein [Rickettsiales bacterium]